MLLNQEPSVLIIQLVCKFLLKINHPQLSLPFGSLQSSLSAIQNLISVHIMSNSWYAIPDYNAASSCGSLQFSSNDLSIVTTLILQNSGSEKEKRQSSMHS